MAAALRLATPADEFALDPLERRLDRLLQLAEARPDQPVGVAGHGSLDVMCALARRGFQRVEAARRCTCGCADEHCQLLIVTGHDAVGIATAVEAVAAMLSPGGRLGILAYGLHGATEHQRLRNLLAHRGFRYRPGDVEAPVLIATKPHPEDLA
jgi:hypothetical protein